VTEDWDVVVVGAGSSGCALAARLADAGRRVLVLEAGADHRAGFPAELTDAATMAAAGPGHPANWDLRGELIDGLTVPVPRGRVVGGCSALNAGSFIRGTRADFDSWAGTPLWSYEAVLPAFRRSEADREFGDRPVHSTDGPVPVRRVPAGHPLADGFAAAAEELGHPAEPDKNAGDGLPGYGPVPLNVADGRRINMAMAYLVPRRGMAGLTVRGGVRVLRIVLERGRAVGVATTEGVLRAGEVVLSAGAVGSPHLLLLSGIGPADELRRAGIDVVADVPGVGVDFTDHPNVYLGYRPARPLPLPPLPLQGVLHATSSGADLPGDLEVLPWLTPFSRITGGPATAHTEELVVGIGLQRPESRGRLTLDGAEPIRPPRLAYGYLAEEADRRGLREGVRLAAELLRSRALAPLVAARSALPDAVLDSDAGLDAWVRAHLTTAIHLSGSARMGPESDPGAVVDQELRVRGVAGLRVVDTSVLPRVTSRGPAATAVMIGERAAELMA
jgi:choline dehydrogenase